MKSGICPKCASDEIYQSPDGELSAATHTLIKRAWHSVTQVNLLRLICANCGYVETYVADEKLLPDIRKYWKPFNKTKRKNE
jgi:predicted nucleic-acid-binding Zn-ribbon protein